MKPRESATILLMVLDNRAIAVNRAAHRRISPPVLSLAPAERKVRPTNAVNDAHTLDVLETVFAARHPGRQAVGATEVMNGKRNSFYGWMLCGGYGRTIGGRSRIPHRHSAHCADVRPLDRHRAGHPQLKVDKVGSAPLLRVLARA